MEARGGAGHARPMRPLFGRKHCESARYSTIFVIDQERLSTRETGNCRVPTSYFEEVGLHPMVFSVKMNLGQELLGRSDSVA